MSNLLRHIAITMLAVAVASGASAGSQRASRWSPDQVFVQAGIAEGAQAVVFGATWPVAWERDFASGRAHLYWEASFGRWNAENEGRGRSSAWVTQVSITPVLRWHPRAWGDAWFVEAGIGANVLLPIYRSGDKQFSTAFNFGDHLAIGRGFGESNMHELVLRMQHFSNAGIKHPNPGENFLQLRYAWHY